MLLISSAQDLLVMLAVIAVPILLIIVLVRMIMSNFEISRRKHEERPRSQD